MYRTHIVKAKVLGFCMGVRRAVDLTCEAVEQSQSPVYTLGPLIHNPQVLEDLTRRGVQILSESQLVTIAPHTPVIIRAHGVGPQTEAALRNLGAVVIDATCPRVKASQLKAAAYAQAGYRLFLAGEADHAEIIGIKDYFTTNQHEPHKQWSAWENNCCIVSNAAEAEKAAAKLHANAIPQSPVALIGQTTISAEEYRSIGDAIARFFPELEIAQTICPATRERQDSLREIFDKVDALMVAGGKESANTRRLFAIAQTSGKPCALVESAGDIPPEFLRYGTIGLSAGASTPDTVIDAILAGAVF